jgi:hypothetical protein
MPPAALPDFGQESQSLPDFGQPKLPDFGQPELPPFKPPVAWTSEGPVYPPAEPSLESQRSIYEEPTFVDRAAAAVRSKLSPILGETEQQQQQRLVHTPGLIPSISEAATAPLLPVFGKVVPSPETTERILNFPATLARERLEETPDEQPTSPTLERIAQITPSQKTSAVVSGATKALADTADFFTSPLGIATLGTSQFPAAAQRSIAAAFSAQMAKEVPEIATQLGDELGKPEEQRDYQKIGNLITAGVVNTGFSALGGAHAAGAPEAPTAPNPVEVSPDTVKDLVESLTRGQIRVGKEARPGQPELPNFGPSVNAPREPEAPQAGAVGEQPTVPPEVTPPRKPLQATLDELTGRAPESIPVTQEVTPQTAETIAEKKARALAALEKKPEPPPAPEPLPEFGEDMERQRAAEEPQGEWSDYTEKVEPPKKPADPVEDWLTKAIEATDPTKGGQLMEGVTSAPIWLTKTIANGALRTVLAAYRSGKRLAHAIDEGVKWLRAQNIKDFDENHAREWLTGEAQRAGAVEPEQEAPPPAGKLEALKAVHERAAEQVTELGKQVEALRAKHQKPGPELRQQIREAIDAHRRSRRELLASPEYVQELLRQLEQPGTGEERAATMENIRAELEQVPTDVLQSTYRRLQQEGKLRPSTPFPEIASLHNLTAWLRSHDVGSPKLSMAERLALVRQAARESLARTKDRLQSAWVGTAAWWKARVEAYRRATPPQGDFRDALKDWHAKDTQTGWETYDFQRLLRQRVPDSVRRQAIIAWLQAGGDLRTLKLQASSVPEQYRRIWETAQRLTPGEERLARQVAADFKSKLEDGMNAGIVESAHDNYAPQIWKKPPKAPEGQEGAEGYTAYPGNWAAKLDTRDPFFYFHKAFHNYYEGIMAGGVPRSLDVADLVGVYNAAFNKALSSRAVVKNLLDAKAPDGMPVVMVSGKAERIGETGETSKPYLIDARYRGKAAVTADGRPYRSLNQPALRDWKWVERADDGRNILVKGDMLVHPDVYGHLKHILEESPLREGAAGKIFKPLLATSAFLKSSKLALGIFHLATEAEHAIFHGTNPWLGKFKIDFTNPEQSGLVRGGLDLGMNDARSLFSEGLGSQGGILKYVPGLGKVAGKVTDWLFKYYIPTIKMRMALHALERNRSRYQGKLSADEINELTANQSNAAFGALNYRLLGRSPLLMDIMRLTVLAPDFLEARMKFVGQAFKPYGAEQRRALLIMGATTYAGARILNALFDDNNDPHWAPKDAFAVFHGGRRYSLRTVLADAWHMFSDPRSFWYNRVSPITRTAIEATTSRDWRGIKRTSLEQIEDFASWVVPVPLEGLVPGARSRETTLASAALQSVGVGSRKASPASDIRDKAADFNRSSNDPAARRYQERMDAETHAESDYRRLDDALDAGDQKRAAREYRALIDSGHKPERIDERYREIHNPFTGTQGREKQFKQTLSGPVLRQYAEAMKERQTRLDKFHAMLGGRL